jgi:hypothetical protein
MGDAPKKLPVVEIPLDEYVTEIIHETVRQFFERHVATCEIGALSKRVGRLEIRLVALVCLMLGSGAMGGLSAYAAKFLLGG